MVYRYLRPSVVVADQGRADLRLSTSGGLTADGPAISPHFFDGFLDHAEQMGTALLVVAKVARTRFWMPPGMVAARVRAADPVVTSNGDRLRFESFSACGGVYARLDILPEALDGPAATGTTNVDFNPPMRDALAWVAGWDPIRLKVGDDVELTTMDGTVIERRVPLPQRWLKGFAEVQLACASMQPALELRAADARAFLRGLPTTSTAGGAAMYAAPTARGARLTSRPGPGAVPLAGPQRLRVLEPLLRYASRLLGYAHGAGPGAGTWELALRDARLTVTVSPDLGRGFSGEGGVLWDLADDRSADDADLVNALLAFEPRIDVADLARGAGLTVDQVRTALVRLAAAGRVGYDCHEQAYFHRELPYDAAALEAMHPRLQAARALVDAGMVHLDPADPTIARVRGGSGDGEYVVRMVAGSPGCTCPWYGRHRDSRGPCKHALAADLARRVTPR